MVMMVPFALMNINKMAMATSFGLSDLFHRFNRFPVYSCVSLGRAYRGPRASRSRRRLRYEDCTECYNSWNK